jgi:hypothetical protein
VNEWRILQECQHCYQEKKQLERALGAKHIVRSIKGFRRPRRANGASPCALRTTTKTPIGNGETVNENLNGTPEKTVAARQCSVFGFNQVRVFR